MMTPIYQKLIEIRDGQSFEELESFKDDKVWTQMAFEERELFAFLLNRQGAQLIEKGDLKFLEGFELAAKATTSPYVYYDQGLIFARYVDNVRCLTWAHQAFTKAVERDPNFVEAWYRGGQVLAKLGLFDGECHYFVEADHKFEKAAYLMDQNVDFSKEDFYWHWGFCLAALGRFSGEPHDFHRAIQKYQIVAQDGCQQGLFFIDYGHALADLANLLERPEMYAEALALFDQAIKLAPDNPDGWYNQASCLHRLSELTHQEDYFELAHESLAKAVEMNPNNGQLWFKWGHLDATVGKLKRDQKRIESSLEKFAKAHLLEPEHAPILSCWGEIELFLGSHEERLDLLQSAKSKIIKCLELHSEIPDVWYLYGSCLNELGRYFADEKLYLQAIEKFQYGLSLSRENPLLWYGSALAYFALGELNEDATMFEKSSQYCAKVTEYGGGVLSQFWNDWGVTLLRLAETTNQPIHIESAIEKFERALSQPLADLEPDEIDLEWVYNYGCAFDLLGDLTDNPRHFEKAVQVLSQVLQLDPDYVHARYNLALSLSHLGEATSDIDYYYKAIEHFQILLENDPEDELAQMDLGISLVNLALLIQEAHEPEKAQGLYRQAEVHLMQSASLGNSQTYYQLAGLYSLTNHYSNAMHYMERAQIAGTLPAIEDLMHDDWLDGLRQTSTFRYFLSQLSSQQSKDDK